MMLSLFVCFGILAAAGPLLLREVVAWRYAPRQAVTLPEGEPYETAIVFGAAVRQGYPTTVLRDRLDTAIDLYQSGQVRHLLMSGDGKSPAYDEPEAMALYAMAQGVPAEAIMLDRFGLRTYDTCYRANAVFGLDRAVLVTQRFHLPRALFTCDLLGIEAFGVSADRRTYRSERWHSLRELLALTLAAWDGIVQHTPQGGLEP